jgi:hypothetical protein
MRDLPRPNENTPESEYLHTIMELRGAGDFIFWKLDPPSPREHEVGYVERTAGYEDSNGESYIFPDLVWHKMSKYNPEWMKWGYTKEQIYKRIADRGWIASHDENSWTTIKNIRGKNMRVLHLTAAALLNDVTDEELEHL